MLLALISVLTRYIGYIYQILPQKGKVEGVGVLKRGASQNLIVIPIYILCYNRWSIECMQSFVAKD